MKRLLTALSILLLSPVAVSANVYEEHDQLYRSLQRAGVTLRVNNTDLCGDNWGGGHYNSLYRTLVICQDGARHAKTREGVQWTSNDMDTLRHEAHHVVQDCLDGTLGDNKLTPLYRDRQKWKAFVQERLSEEQIDRIIKDYTSMGADEDVLRLELEAFAASASVPARQLALAVTKACSS